MQEDAYTFLGNSKAGATLFMDIAVFSEDRARKHALFLLAQHNSADVVEIWRTASLIGEIPCPALAGLPPSTVSKPAGRSSAFPG